MKTTCFLVFNARGVVGVRKSIPSMRSGEFAVRLALSIPDALFKPDVPTIDLVIPERAMILPVVEIVEPPAAAPSTPSQEGK